MNCIYKIICSVALSISVALSVQAATPELSVNIPNLSVNLNYQHPARLSQLLSDTQNLIQKRTKNIPFWLAAQLLQKDKNEQITLLKANILKKLQLLSDEKPQSSIKAKLLTSFIKNNHFNYRHFISLDNDFIRITAENDPLLKGKFTLLIPNRINKIRIVGSMKENQTADLIEHAAIDDYLKTLTLPDNSDTSVAYIIQPDGAISKVNNAYWRHDPIFFAPATILFIGFNSLPNEYSSLNMQIAELLRYLTPLTMEGKGL